MTDIPNDKIIPPKIKTLTFFTLLKNSFFIFYLSIIRIYLDSNLNKKKKRKRQLSLLASLVEINLNVWRTGKNGGLLLYRISYVQQRGRHE